MNNEELVVELKNDGIPVSETCRILQLPRSSIYRNLQKDPGKKKRLQQEDHALIELIRTISADHPFWGYRRVTAYIRYRHGLLVNRKRILRLMRLEGLLVPQKRYKAKRTEGRSKPRATAPNHWWGTDMTKFYVQNTGWIYLVVLIDWYTKRVLGYSINIRPNTDLWLSALLQAVQTACPLGSRAYGINLMSDNGSQPTSKRYEKELKMLGINHVTTSYNNPKGNADTERFMRTFKEEVIWPNEFESFQEAVDRIDIFFHFYNNEYPHSTIGGMSPIAFENSLNQKSEAA